MSLAIRPATPDDVPLVLQFIRELAEYEREPDAVEATVPMLADALFGERPAAEVLIAEWEGAPAGFALFFHNFSTWKGRRGLYLEDLFVRPALRGRGIGEALLVRLAAIAAARGCGRMEWSVLDWNESAIGFYRKLGAQLMDGWTTCRVDAAGIAALGARGGSGNDGTREPGLGTRERQGR